METPLYNKGFKPSKQVGLFLGIWGVSFIIGVFISFLLVIWLKLPTNNTEALLHPQHGDALRFLQLVTTFFIFGLPAVVFSFYCYTNGWLALGFKKQWIWPIAGLSVFIILAGGPMTDTLGTFNKWIPIPSGLRTIFNNMEQAYESQVKAMMDMNSIGGYLGSLVIVSILPAFFEEIFFRGGIQGLLTRWLKNPWVAILITSLLFSAVHGSWYGFIPRLFLGGILGIVFYITGNIWYSILMHFINNAAAVTYIFVLNMQGKPIDFAGGTGLPWWSGLVALALIAWLLKYLYDHYPPVNIEERPASVYNPFVFDYDTKNEEEEE